MSEAEKAARKGLDINKHDLWSQHNVSRIFYGLHKVDIYMAVLLILK